MSNLGRKSKIGGVDVGDRLSRRSDHFERERAVILNQAAKEKHMYNKSLQDLKAVKATTSHFTAAGSSLLRGPATGEGSGRPQSKQHFSRYLLKGEPERLPRALELSRSERSQGLSRTPDMRRTPRRLAPLSGEASLSESRVLPALLPGNNIRRSSSEKSLLWQNQLSVESETFRSKSPAFRRKVVAANGNVKTIVDLLPSLKREDDPFGGRKERDEWAKEERKEYGDDHGMSERLSKAVKEIETELAAHGMTLDDVSIKPDIPERPLNLELPDKTKKYQTFGSLPRQIPIPWHLYGAENDDDNEGDDDDQEDDGNKNDGGLKVPPKSRQPSAKTRKKSALRREGVPVNKTLEQEFKELKNCRYLRKYKPNMKREAWF